MSISKDILNALIKRNLQDEIHINTYVYTYISTLFKGVGIAHCIDTNEYFQLPIPLLFPSIFIGYKAYKYKNDIKKFITDYK